MVEFANQQREQHGLSRRDAIVAAAKIRLRPILMTTAAMALGVVPLIIAEGAGAAARYSMGLVIFSGLAGRHAVHALRGADVLHADLAPRPGIGSRAGASLAAPNAVVHTVCSVA